MIRLELWRGARAGEERRTLAFLEQRIDDLEIDEDAWRGALDLMKKARGKGLTAPSQDVLIVATARRHGAAVEHCDRHLGELLNVG